MEQIGKNAILLDSNYVIGVLNGVIPISELPQQQQVISVVTIMEVYALAGMSRTEERRIDEALYQLNVVLITTSIAKRAGILARTRKRGRADLIIAATALECNIPLLTKNIRDFKNIPNLHIL